MTVSFDLTVKCDVWGCGATGSAGSAIVDRVPAETTVGILQMGRRDMVLPEGWKFAKYGSIHCAKCSAERQELTETTAVDRRSETTKALAAIAEKDERIRKFEADLEAARKEVKRWQGISRTLARWHENLPRPIDLEQARKSLERVGVMEEVRKLDEWKALHSETCALQAARNLPRTERETDDIDPSEEEKWSEITKGCRPECAKLTARCRGDGCEYEGSADTFRVSRSPYHDIRCPKCGRTNIDTSELKKALGDEYGYGENNFVENLGMRKGNADQE